MAASPARSRSHMYEPVVPGAPIKSAEIDQATVAAGLVNVFASPELEDFKAEMNGGGEILIKFQDERELQVAFLASLCARSRYRRLLDKAMDFGLLKCTSAVIRVAIVKLNGMPLALTLPRLVAHADRGEVNDAAERLFEDGFLDEQGIMSLPWL